jgi:hypothetical protein
LPSREFYLQNLFARCPNLTSTLWPSLAATFTVPIDAPLPLAASSFQALVGTFKAAMDAAKPRSIAEAAPHSHHDSFQPGVYEMFALEDRALMRSTLAEIDFENVALLMAMLTSGDDPSTYKAVVKLSEGLDGPDETGMSDSCVSSYLSAGLTEALVPLLTHKNLSIAHHATRCLSCIAGGRQNGRPG